MKLARVRHYKCDEIQAYTYVWVDDNLTPEEFKAKVLSAQYDYKEFLKSWKDEAPPHIPYKEHFIRDYKDKTKTLAEIEAEYIELEKPHKEFAIRYEQAKRHFNFYLQKQGFKPFYEHDELVFDVTISWGHNHGLGIEFEDTQPNENDLPGPIIEEEYF